MKSGGPKVEPGENLLLSYFFRSKCPRTSRKLHICDRKFRALVKSTSYERTPLSDKVDADKLTVTSL